jgi:hypothetical protein
LLVGKLGWPADKALPQILINEPLTCIAKFNHINGLPTMSSSLLTFAKGGVHPPESKEITEHLAIEKMPLSEEFEIPLLQHFGAPCQPLVKKKDRVEEGDLKIGRAHV